MEIMRTFRLQALKKISKIIGNIHDKGSIDRKFTEQKYHDKSLDGTRWIRLFKFFMNKKNDADIISFIETCFLNSDFKDREYEYKHAIEDIQIVLKEYGFVMDEFGVIKTII